VKLAESGRGFRRKVLTEPRTPFEIELVQFGGRFLINIIAQDEAHSEAFVKYSLMEEGSTRREGLVMISDGKGSVTLTEEDIEALRPETSPLKIRLEVLANRDVASGLEATDLVKLVERLQMLLESEDPATVEAALEFLKDIEAHTAGEIGTVD
jgi:hypothetical protein